jgi:Sporulation and spore germination
MKRSTFAAIGLWAAVAVITSCGVPRSSTVQRIDSPLGLGDARVPPTTTPLTTTTEPAPTTTPPVPTPPPTSPPQTIPPTTAPPATAPATVPATTQPVPTSTLGPAADLYYIFGDGVQRVPRQITNPTDPQSVLQALEQPAPIDINPSLRNAFTPASKLKVTVKGGVATVEVGADFQSLNPIDLRAATAQIVLSLRLPGIGQVMFQLNGQNIPVRRGDNSNSNPSDKLTFDEYEHLVVNP